MMTNHVHLLCTPQHENSAEQLMKNQGQRYVQYINRTYRRSGTLWEGRFKSCLAHGETYVMTCYRYIELNPVRANRVHHPRDYRWSSYRANAEGRQDSILTPHSLYMRLGQNAGQRETAYRGLFEVDLDPDQITAIRNATNGNYVLGVSRFQEEIEKMPRRRVAPGKSGRPAKCKISGRTG